eukprot:symbB.v1.2.026673.t1/scaffold2684.1/size75764/5
MLRGIMPRIHEAARKPSDLLVLRSKQIGPLAKQRLLVVLLLLFSVGSVRALWRKLLALSVTCLRLTAPLQGAGVRYAPLDGPRSWKRWFIWPGWPGWCWSGLCPCCKRPLEIELCEAIRKPIVAPEALGRYAYLICLWGASAEYMVGAMVLGASIRKTGSKHDRVCLYTEDVPAEYIQHLSKLWSCQLMTHVDVAMDKLSFPDNEERFAKVFTKLRGLGLTQYEKVLMMDIDLLVRSNIDDLFDIPAPAALRRGMNEWGQCRHGESVDGRSFFLGEDKSMPRWSWGQGTGINAGVMLWQPNQEVLDQMLAELSEPNHPEHVRGNGPEQDYLSRYWADSPWTYIGAQYNFQLHQMFFALHPDRVQYAERSNLLQHPEEVRIVHFSGKSTAKPWHRVLDPQWQDFWPNRSRDQEYVNLFAEEFMGYWLWIKRDRQMFETQVGGNSWDLEGMEMDVDGEYRRRSGDRVESLPIPESSARGAMTLLSSVLTEWFDLFQSLEDEVGKLNEKLPVTRVNGLESAPLDGSKRQMLKDTAWSRSSGGGWWAESERTEKDKGQAQAVPKSMNLAKLTVSCGVSSRDPDANFVSLRDSTSVFQERGFDVTGLYIKVHGQTGCRAFSLDNLFPDGLDPLQLWVQGVPEKAIVLMAIVGIESDILPVLQVLSPLGVPQDTPPPETQVLACITIAGSEPESPCANHASPDIAYASLLFEDSDR